MADNTVLPAGSGGDTVRDKDRAGVKTQIVGLDLNPAGSEVLGTGDATNGLDVDVTRSALPTGAATAAKQPALGTAGSASADVVSVQGVASMTAVKVDGSAVTQPVSGTVAVSNQSTVTTGIGDGRKVVTTAGTRVALAASTTALWVAVTAETDNTGIVVVGGASTVVAALATRQGTPLNPGDTATFPCDNLADFGLDAMVSTDGVTYVYGT